MRKLFLSSVVVALICGSAILAQPPLLPRDLPGDPGGSGTVGVTDYRGGLGALDDLATVSRLVEQIKSGDLVPHVTASAQYAITDLADWPWSRPSDPFVAGDPFPFPSDTPADDDDFISIAKGTLMVPETGTYTIQVRSDEGMGLRVIGTPFLSVHGGGRLDTDGSMIHPETTIDADTRGVIQLEAGRHEFEFLMWERRGGAYWEITSARGHHPQANTARWLALGDDRTLSPMGGAPRVASLVGNAQVVNVLNNDEQPADDIDIARDLIRDAREHGEGIIRDDVATIVMEDHDGISHHRPGSWVSGQGNAFHWPLNDPSFGGDAEQDFNHFSSGLFGQLQVDDGDDVSDEILLLTFAMFSSDGSQFHILGQSFTEAIAEHFLFHDIDGETTLTYPDSTAVAEALGLIELQEGVVYDWEGFHYEIDSDAGYEIWGALGNQLHLAEVGPEQFLATFTPLSNRLQTVSVPGNQGLALIEPPALLPGDYNNNRELDAADLDVQASEIAVQNHNPQYDLNDDGLVDYVDRLIWVEELKNTFIGDANLDGEFNSSDFVQVFVGGKYERPQSAGWNEGDWNADRVFDSSDFVAAFAGGGYELGRREDGQRAVPEPNGVMLMWLGFLAGAFFHRGDAEARS